MSHKMCVHKPLKLLNGTLTGGKILPKNVDLEVLLDLKYDFNLSISIYDTAGILTKQEEVVDHRIIYYPIQDQRAPSSVVDTKIIVDEIITYLTNGKNVHVQCIGGHGRTGVILSCVVGTILPHIKDVVDYVRENYCEEAVESYEQHQFIYTFLRRSMPNAVETFMFYENRRTELQRFLKYLKGA